MVQSQVLDMAHARSTDMFGKLKSEVLGDGQSKMIRESDKYAPSSIGLPYITEGNTMKPLYSTYDYDAIMNNGVQAMESPSRIRS
jgi:hypothetical protein